MAPIPVAYRLLELGRDDEFAALERVGERHGAYLESLRLLKLRNRINNRDLGIRDVQAISYRSSLG
jgi:hypothetical protein